MILRDDQLLREVRARPRCENPECGRTNPPFRLHAAHIFSVGAGRVDISGNVLALCAWDHNENHSGRKLTRDDLLRITAERDGTTPQAISDEVWRIRQLPKRYCLHCGEAIRWLGSAELCEDCVVFGQL